MVTAEIIVALLQEEGVDAFLRSPDSRSIGIRYGDERIALFWFGDHLDTQMIHDDVHQGPKFYLYDPNWIADLKKWLAEWKGPVWHA